MKKLRTHLIGVDQGYVSLFSDFEDGGEMWTGEGQREVRRSMTFSDPFSAVPVVHVGLALWDMDHGANQRADLQADAVTEDGFDLVFRTWGDTRVARLHATWLAIGELTSDDQWQVD